MDEQETTRSKRNFAWKLRDTDVAHYFNDAL